MPPGQPAPASTTAAGFIASFSAERRSEVERVRAVIRTNLPPGCEEVVGKRMLVYQVPLKRHAKPCNGHPLWDVALAPEKSYRSLHLMPVYGSKELATRLQAGFAAAGRKLNMGKACVRFMRAEAPALAAIGDIIAAIPVDRWIAISDAARRR